MKNPDTTGFSGPDDSIRETAARWLADREAGLSPAQAAELQRWRDADPRHERIQHEQFATAVVERGNFDARF